MFDPILNWLAEQGASERVADILLRVGLGLFFVLVAALANYVAKRVLLALIGRAIRKTTTDWDDALLQKGFFSRLSHIAPAIVVYAGAPIVFYDHPELTSACLVIARVYMIVVGLLVLDALLNAGLSVYQSYPISRRFHLNSFVQVAKVVFFCLGGIVMLAQVFGRSPIVFLSGLGAMTAVLLLIFKDAILGLVAGIQLTANNMVERGDWISMPKYDADGDVIEVNLTTVKVQNWDKTISTIPTYALISDSFQNWRGMQESGGRRIKRSVAIDMTSVRICDAEMIGRFEKFAYIHDYVEKKQKEVVEWNRAAGFDDDTYLINGRRLTNLGTFRVYVEAYLRNHPELNQEMTLLVRHRDPSDKGIPIEIYCFSANIAWAAYEGIQADIFDHILAVVPMFDLRVFQSPSGHDVTRAAEQLRSGGKRPAS